jgi:hypothetical protein
MLLRRRLVLLSLSLLLVGVLGGGAVAYGKTKRLHASADASTTTVYGPLTPTFVGPAATGCASDCSLLSGPFTTSSTAPPSTTTAAPTLQAAPLSAGPHAMPAPSGPFRALGSLKAAIRGAGDVTPIIPNVRCQPLGLGCDTISNSANGATAVKGLNAVDSGSLNTNPNGDVEPPDQGFCAGNGYIVQANNIGEILVFNTALARQSTPISLDTVMGLTSRAWSSAGDTSCDYDPSNGGHWFFTEIVSASPEASGGAFTGCFAGVANDCYEGIAVSQTSSPFGPYWVYYLNADYNPAEPGYPSLLNDFAKISTTRDALLLFYDEFPLLPGTLPGFGGGAFNGAQEFAFDKKALETGRRVTLADGSPNPNFNVARENMGLLPTPDGPCAGVAGDPNQPPGVNCWVAVIPAQPADSGQWDNHYNGTGFMIGALDFKSFATLPSPGDDRIAVWDWTGLRNLDSGGCTICGGIQFGGELFTGTDPYYDPENSVGDGYLAPQKAGPIPLGAECGAAGLSTDASCPENGLNSNGDFMTQVSQAQGQLWAGMTTEVNQLFSSSSEIHEGGIYWVIDTGAFDKTRQFDITNQGYVTASHEDLVFPTMAAEGTGGNGKAIMAFTLSGNGGPSGADRGGYYPSTAYGRLTATSDGLTGSVINIADAGKSPQDGFSEYQGYPGLTRPRWGDYGWAIYLPGGSDRMYFSNEYIQYPNCTGSAFTLTIGTCNGTRDGFANWGTSVNYVVP